VENALPIQVLDVTGYKMDRN